MNIFDETLVIVVESANVAGVYSVNGKAGYVTIDKSDIGISEDLVYLTGNQTISGTKNFATRPQVNNIGVLISGEAYPSNNPSGFITGVRGNEAFSCEETTGSTNGVVNWVLSFNTIGGFSNSRFTVPTGKAGLYMFNTAVFYELYNTPQMELAIYVNNNRVRAFYTSTFDGIQGQAQVFGVINLAVGNVVSVRVNFFGDPEAYVRDDIGVSWFTAVRL